MLWTLEEHNRMAESGGFGMEQTKPKIHTSFDVQWICECLDVMEATSYPINLTKDSVEIVCRNKNCKWKDKIIGVKLEQREVLYVSES